jgi:hypothetical protein
MRCVKVAQDSPGVARENGNSRVLSAFAVFAAKVVLEAAVGSAQETQFIPTPSASVGAQSRDVGGRDNREVKVLSKVVCDPVSAVKPGGAHGTRLGLFLSEHEVIDDQRAIRLGEEFAEADVSHRRVTRVEVTRALFELIILNSSTLRKIAAKLCYAFTLVHELDLGQPNLFTLGKILVGFRCQIGQPIRSINECVNHDGYLRVADFLACSSNAQSAGGT